MTHTYRTLCILGVLLCALLPAPPATAQVGWVDTDTVSTAEALALVEQRVGDHWVLSELLRYIGQTGDASYIEPLQQLAGELALSDTLRLSSFNALYALRVLGAPRAYFLENAFRYAENPWLSAFSINVLAQSPDSVTLEEIMPLWDELGMGYTGMSEAGKIVRSGISSYAITLASVADYEQIEAPYDRAVYLIGQATRGFTPWGNFEIGNESSGYHPRAVWARRTLKELYAEHPDVVEEAIARSAERVNPGYEAVVSISNDYLREEVLAGGTKLPPPLPPPDDIAPPVKAAADVRPILECVAAVAGGDSLRAFFGYENHVGEAVTVAYGPGNRLTPSRYQGRQPEVFEMPQEVEGRPGRTAWYPGHAFAVTFASDERLVWTLSGRTATASINPQQRCPQ